MVTKIMIKEFPCYTVICDRCEKDSNDGGDYAGFGDAAEAREQADYDDWKVIDDKDYCQTCWMYGEGDDEPRPLPPKENAI